MSDLKLNADHDLDITSAAITLVSDDVDSPEAIAQELRIALQLHRGEWFLNLLVGIPYLDQVFVKNPSLGALTILFTRALSSVPGVLEVLKLELVFDNATRVLSIDFAVRAQSGGVIEDHLAVLL